MDYCHTYVTIATYRSRHIEAALGLGLTHSLGHKAEVAEQAIHVRTLESVTLYIN